MNNIKVVEEVEYTGKFKIGEEVRISAVTNNEHEWERYLSDLGRTGIITTIDKHDEYSYYVQFNTGGEEWFNEATLELTTNKNKTEQNSDTDSLKLKTFEILTGETDVKYIEKELRDYAELAVDDYDYDRAIEIYALIKEWNNLK